MGMATEQVQGSKEYKLPFERIFSMQGSCRVIDCMLSNYDLEQTIENISKYTNLDTTTTLDIIENLTKENVIIKIGKSYKTNFKSDRLIGLFSYYRATQKENLKSLEYLKTDYV